MLGGCPSPGHLGNISDIDVDTALLENCKGISSPPEPPPDKEGKKGKEVSSTLADLLTKVHTILADAGFHNRTLRIFQGPSCIIGPSGDVNIEITLTTYLPTSRPTTDLNKVLSSSK